MSFCYMNIIKHLSCWWAQTRSDPETNSAPGPKEEEVQLRTCEQLFKTGLTTTTTTSHIMQTNNQHKSKKQDMQRLNQRLNESSSQSSQTQNLSTAFIICWPLQHKQHTHTQSIFPFDFALRLFEPSLPFFWINNFFCCFFAVFLRKNLHVFTDRGGFYPLTLSLQFNQCTEERQQFLTTSWAVKQVNLISTAADSRRRRQQEQLNLCIICSFVFPNKTNAKKINVVSRLPAGLPVKMLKA